MAPPLTQLFQTVFGAMGGRFSGKIFLEGKEIRIRGRQWYAQGGEWDNCMFSVCTEEPAEGIRWILQD